MHALLLLNRDAVTRPSAFCDEECSLPAYASTSRMYGNNILHTRIAFEASDCLLRLVHSAHAIPGEWLARMSEMDLHFILRHSREGERESTNTDTMRPMGVSLLTATHA